MENQKLKSINDLIDMVDLYVDPYLTLYDETEQKYQELSNYRLLLETCPERLDGLITSEWIKPYIKFKRIPDVKYEGIAKDALASAKDLRFANVVQSIICKPDTAIITDNNLTALKKAVESITEEELQEFSSQRESSGQKEILAFLNEPNPEDKSRYHHIFYQVALSAHIQDNLAPPYKYYFPENDKPDKLQNPAMDQYDDIEHFIEQSTILAELYQEYKITMQDIEAIGNLPVTSKLSTMLEALENLEKEEKEERQKTIRVPKNDGPNSN